MPSPSTTDLAQKIQTLFPVLDQWELVQLFIKHSKWIELPQQTEILRPDQFIQFIPLVLEGSIKVFREDDAGREILLYYISPGQSCAFTLEAALRRHRSKIRAVTQTPSQLLVVDLSQMPFSFTRYPAWQNFVLETFSSRFGEVLLTLEGVVFHSLDERLRQYLQKKRQTLQTDIIDISHQQIANELATSREVVSRLLKQMEREGTIALGRGRITFIWSM